MSEKFNDLLYHTQSIFNYHHCEIEFNKNGSIIWEVVHKDKQFNCPICHSNETSCYRDGFRNITGLAMGESTVIIRAQMHRIKCSNCNRCSRERLDFTYSQKSRFTKTVAQRALKLRSVMTIMDVSKLLGISWVAVKSIEFDYLEKKYKYIDFTKVENIGIDEIWTGSAFLSIVRDMDDGRTLHVAEGKDGACLGEFTKQLKKECVELKNICIDMGAAYTKWAKDYFPNAVIIYDKFHIIKLMNEKVSQVRRKVMNELDEEDKKELKGQRYLLLRNEEGLAEKSKEKLDLIRNTYKDVGEMSVFKECLRRVYKTCTCSIDAEYALAYWVKIAKETGVSALKTMAKTIKQKMKGIVSYFDTGLTSASMEGFNNKIGWMNRMAYGYNDLEYFKLKIYDLPHLKLRLED